MRGTDVSVCLGDKVANAVRVLSQYAASLLNATSAEPPRQTASRVPFLYAYHDGVQARQLRSHGCADERWRLCTQQCTSKHAASMQPSNSWLGQAQTLCIRAG